MPNLEEPATNPDTMCVSIARFVALFAAVAFPDVIVIGFYTAMGAGAALFGIVADDTMNNGGNLLVLCSAFFMATLFVCDWNKASRAPQLILGLLQLSLFCAAATLKGVSYPWAGGLLCLLSSVMVLSVLRQQSYPLLGAGGSEFYRIAVWAYLLCATLILISWIGWMSASGRWWTEETIAWLVAENQDVYDFLGAKLPSVSLNYTMHCSDQKSLGSYSDALQADISSACKKSEQCLVLAVVGPFRRCDLPLCLRALLLSVWPPGTQRR